MTLGNPKSERNEKAQSTFFLLISGWTRAAGLRSDLSDFFRVNTNILDA